MKQPPDTTLRRLLILGNGAIVVVPTKRNWQPLLRRGWVEPAPWSSEAGKGLPPLQITPAGLRALADWLDRCGGHLPDPAAETSS